MSSNMKDVTREMMVSQFQKAMGQPIDVPYSKGDLHLRMRLINEEVKELEDEVKKAKQQLDWDAKVSDEVQENILKELCDIMYVVSGFAVTFGLPVQPAFVRVHHSNMSKLVDGKPVVDAGGKVLKGENYCPPSMKGLL